MKDFVNCEGCHGSGNEHYGKGQIPNPIPDTKTCGQCHNPPSFDFPKFLLTRHSNQNNRPDKFFDQGKNGKEQAIIQKDKISLFKANRSNIVTKNERIEECSICHNYALGYPQFTKKISKGEIPQPEVSCGACHDAHIPKPSGNHLINVNTTIKVDRLSGLVISEFTPAEGRKVAYRNLKPYKIDEKGAQNPLDGIWTRGSSIARPYKIILSGEGILSNHLGISDRLSFFKGGFLNKVKPHQTIFISGQASTTVKLPSDAINAGSEVTVQATFDKVGFEIENVIDDNLIVFHISLHLQDYHIGHLLQILMLPLLIWHLFIGQRKQFTSTILSI